MYTVCTGVGMVSGKCDGVLSDDSSGVTAFIGFYYWNVLSGIHMVCVSARCKKYIFQFYLYFTIFVAMFYSVKWVTDGVRCVIEHNPLYVFIYIMRQCVLYGQNQN